MFQSPSTKYLVFAAFAAAVGGDAFAQQFVSPTGQTGRLPYGGQPVVQVAPDGAVHLDGPMAGYSMPLATTQPVPVAQQPTGFTPFPANAGNRFRNWLFNNPIPYQYEHRTSVYGEFLFIRPRNAEVAYALPIDGPVAPVLGNEVPIGTAAVVDYDYEPAFRVGFNLRLREDSSIGMQYSYLRADDSSSATIDPADGVLRSLVSHPGAANAATDSLDATATIGIDYDLVDVDYRALMEGCESCEGKFADVVNYIFGARYARMDQDFSSIHFDTNPTLNSTLVRTNVDFEGGGIRAGLESERHATNHGMYLYGRGVANLMVGEFSANYTQINTINGTAGVEATTSWEAGRVVPALDLELGFGWVAPRRRLRFSGGYLVSTWFNVVKTEDFINAAQTHNFDNLSSILTFDGLVARAEWQF